MPRFRLCAESWYITVIPGFRALGYVLLAPSILEVSGEGHFSYTRRENIFRRPAEKGRPSQGVRQQERRVYVVQSTAHFWPIICSFCQLITSLQTAKGPVTEL